MNDAINTEKISEILRNEAMGGSAREMTPAEIGQQARVQAELRQCQQWREQLDRIRTGIMENNQFGLDDESRGEATRIREATMWLREQEMNLRRSQAQRAGP